MSVGTGFQPAVDLDHQPGYGAGGLLFGNEWLVIGGRGRFTRSTFT
jgi:hypothetical protein